jgi:hypothetical protein
MKSALPYQIQLDFTQIVQIVRQLSADDKIRLSKELEKEAISSKLTRLLKSFKTNDLSEDEIARECDIVREKLYQKSYEK